MIQHQPTNSRGNYNYNAFVYTETRYHSHFHANYELIHVLEGEVPCQVGGKDLTLAAGQTLLISPYTVHAFFVTNGARAWVGVFSEDHIPAFAAAHGGTQFAPFVLSSCEALLRVHLFIEEKPELYRRIALLYTV